MEMKKLLESLEECGMAPMGAPEPMDRGTPVSMNVSLNASGKDHVEDLINMMKNAGMSGAKEVGPMDMPAMPMRMDMERLRDIVDGPKKLAAPEGIEEGFDGEITDEVWDAIVARKQELMGPDEDQMEPEDAQDQAAEELGVDPEELDAWLEAKFGEGYDNEPDEQFGDLDSVTRSGDDLHKRKKAYPKASGGDNAMALEQEILKALKADYASKK